VPALQANRADGLALLVVEDLEEGGWEAGADLGRGTAQVNETFGAVVEDGHRTPTLGLGFGLVDHELTLLGRGMRVILRPRLSEIGERVKVKP
jgi:hypothetical protein